MKFRPCIDIHNGKVKQIVGGSLLDQGDQAVENFAADQEADYFANLYKTIVNMYNGEIRYNENKENSDTF